MQAIVGVATLLAPYRQTTKRFFLRTITHKKIGRVSKFQIQMKRNVSFEMRHCFSSSPVRNERTRSGMLLSYLFKCLVIVVCKQCVILRSIVNVFMGEIMGLGVLYNNSALIPRSSAYLSYQRKHVFLRVNISFYVMHYRRGYGFLDAIFVRKRTKKRVLLYICMAIYNNLCYCPPSFLSF